MTTRHPLCTYCAQPLGPAHIIVHDANPAMPSGQYHLDHCWLAARAEAEAVEKKLKLADVAGALADEHFHAEVLKP